jgi:hypothetical protein
MGGATDVLINAVVCRTARLPLANARLHHGNRRTILLVSIFATVSPQPHARLIREAQNNPFTIGCRDNRDASVHLLLPDAYAHTPVLRTPTFRDIEIGHHLDAGK